jgi:tryptophan-rich sensory protein
MLEPVPAAIIHMTTTKRRPLLGLLGWFALCFAAAAIGAIGSRSAPEFYSSLSQPGWAPPAAWFGPVWTVLYALMAIAAWLVWRKDGFAGARAALTLFVAQLVFNTWWSWFFFAWHRGALALADIAVLWVLVAATIVAFWFVRRLAAVLMVPYLAWVSFATALNFAVWRMNPALLG